MIARRDKLNYERARQWLIQNDDNGWIMNKPRKPTRAAEVICVVFARAPDELAEDLIGWIRSDLKKSNDKHEPKNGTDHKD